MAERGLISALNYILECSSQPLVLSIYEKQSKLVLVEVKMAEMLVVSYLSLVRAELSAALRVRVKIELLLQEVRVELEQKQAIHEAASA